MDKFAIAWIIWILWFLGWEFYAIFDGVPGGTFSDHVRLIIKLGGSLVAFLVVAFCLWLGWHFVFEKGNGG